MFNALYSVLAALLNFFYELIPNFAVAIALLTVAVMLLLFPLNAKSARSMAAMAKLNPELQRLRQKHKNDRVKLNEETMALFKQHNVTPFGGCLPVIAQMPVLFVMFHLINGLTHIPKGASGFAPKYLDEGSALYRALEGRTEMVAFGMDLAKTASEAAKASLIVALPFFLLIAAVVATGYYQQWMISRRNPQQGVEDNPMARQMQTMTKIFPLMYLVLGFAWPAALNVYFLISSLFRIGQQTLIYKLDPSLLPGSGATTIPSREVTKDAKGKDAKGKDAKPGAVETTGNGSVNGAVKTPAGSGKKKKKRR